MIVVSLYAGSSFVPLRASESENLGRAMPVPRHSEQTCAQNFMRRAYFMSVVLYVDDTTMI